MRNLRQPQAGENNQPGDSAGQHPFFRTQNSPASIALAREATRSTPGCRDGFRAPIESFRSDDVGGPLARRHCLQDKIAPPGVLITSHSFLLSSLVLRLLAGCRMGRRATAVFAKPTTRTRQMAATARFNHQIRRAFILRPASRNRRMGSVGGRGRGERNNLARWGT